MKENLENAGESDRERCRILYGEDQEFPRRIWPWAVGARKKGQVFSEAGEKREGGARDPLRWARRRTAIRV